MSGWYSYQIIINFYSYEWKDDKLVNNAFFPRKVLRAIKKTKIVDSKQIYGIMFYLI